MRAWNRKNKEKHSTVLKFRYFRGKICSTKIYSKASSWNFSTSLQVKCSRYHGKKIEITSEH